MTRGQINWEFIEKSRNILDAEEQGLLDRDEAQRIIDRYRDEAEEQIRLLAREVVRQ